MRSRAGIAAGWIAAGCILACPLGADAAEKRIPEWARDAIADTSRFGAGADAVVLYRELDVRVTREGRVITHGRMAVRVLTPSGSGLARLLVHYVDGQGRPPELAAVLVRAASPDAPLPIGPHADIVADGTQVRSEVRARLLDASGRAVPGDVLVAEWTHDDAPPFLDFDLRPGVGLPVRRAVARITWPPEWKLTVRRLPDGGVDSVSGQGQRSWAFDRLEAPRMNAPGRAGDPMRIALSFTPDRPLKARTFGDWAAVAKWIGELAKGQDSGADVERQAREAAEVPGERERLGRLAGPPQAARYVSLEIGLGRGGGYRPRAAHEVLDLGYGDCKDKANLFCALARAAGLRAWLVPVRLGGREYVHPDWPSPQQFNHCIAAVAVSDTLRAPAIVRHPALGPLLFFDATDPDTPLGELPAVLQGSLALIADPDHGGLLRLPESPPGHDRAEWNVRGDMTERGAARGDFARRMSGTAAAEHRAARRVLGDTECALAVTKQVARRAPGTTLTEVRFVDGLESEIAVTEGRWAAAGWGRAMSLGEIVVHLPALGERAGITRALTDAGAELRSREEEEAVWLRVPPGFRLVGAPADTTLARPPFRFECRTRWEGDTLIVKRSWGVARGEVRPDDVNGLREWLRQLDAEERAVWRLAPAASRP